MARRHPILKLARFPEPKIASDRPRQTRIVFEESVRSGNAMVPNVGSGVHKHYPNPNLVNLDISPHGNVDVVGDGMAMPFLDAAFDGAVLDAVLEHVPDPWRLVDEVRRVLRPGGFVLAHAPFLYPYHGAPHDYFRYTDEGLRQVFREFEEVECDSDHLPTRALLEVLRAYAGIFADGRKRSFALRFAAAWCTLPMKFLDHYLKHKMRSQVVVTGFSYLGRKRQ
jgi:SAM-dependent methyltransferase